MKVEYEPVCPSRNCTGFLPLAECARCGTYVPLEGFHDIDEVVLCNGDHPPARMSTIASRVSVGVGSSEIDWDEPPNDVCLPFLFCTRSFYNFLFF